LELTSNIVVARLMTRRYVDALVKHEEYEVFMAGLWVITGFEQIAYKVKKHSTSETTYTITKKISQLVNSVTSFSNAPLVWIFFIGSVIFLLSAIYGVYLVVNWLFLSEPPSGYTSLMTSIWVLGGMIIAFLGVIGVYLSKIYSESKHRPYTIVRELLRKDTD
jgi:putative glycosyltransferase